jgi:hypothetical protein
MKAFSAKSGLLALSMLLGGAQGALAGDTVGIGKEWSRSGFGGKVTYKCKQPSCGGPNNMMIVQSFGSISGAPQLGIPSGSNLEAEFRHRPEVRRTLAAMLQQFGREPRNKGTSFKTSYFENSTYAGFNFSFFDSNKRVHLVGQLRISDNKVIMVGGASYIAAAARRNFNIISPAIKTN